MTLEARAKEVFLDALELAESQREAFVRDACGGDAALCSRVEDLLAASASADRRLSAQPLGLVLEAGTRLGPYQLVAPLGEGGFGVVWRARQEAPVRREVAIKVLRGVGNADGIARFEIERQALAALTHPGIARVYDGGTAHGRPWFAMELVEGEPITTWVRRHRASTRTRLALFLETCRAIQHAHQRGVIHRDVKPSNVLVGDVDGEPRVKVLDFGIARVEGELQGDWTRQTLTGQVLGTPGYMSPEQIRDTRDVDTRSDVYSLGVLLYELLVDVAPFDTTKLRERGPSEALRTLCEVDPPRPSARAASLGGAVAERARELRGDLDWIVMCCLEKDRERRYPSVAGLIADVERHLRGEPVLAGPPSRVYRARKFARRHRLALGLSAATALALVGGTAWALLELQRARRAERAEAQAAASARLESERAQSIAEFLEHLLLSIDPAIARGRDVTLLREILDRAALGIADRGDRPPLVEASLRRIIGGAYASLGDHGPALEQLEQALALRREHLGDDAPETIELQGEVGGVLLLSGRLLEGEAMLAPALARARATFGEDDERTLTMLENHASAQRSLGRPEESLELLGELVERRARTLGPGHDSTLLALNNWALALSDAGRAEAALEPLRRIMEAQIARNTERHPRSLIAMNNYAGALQSVGRLDESEALVRRVLDLKRELLSPDHPSVIVSMNNLAKLLEQSGEHEEALRMLDAALELVQAGADQPPAPRMNRPDPARPPRRLAEAAQGARLARAVARETTGEDSPLSRACEDRLANALLDAGEAIEAEPFARRLYETLATDPRTSAESRANAMLRLGLVLALLGKDAEARALLTAGLADPAAADSWRERAAAALER